MGQADVPAGLMPIEDEFSLLPDSVGEPTAEQLHGEAFEG